MSSDSDHERPVEFLGIDHNPVSTIKEEPTNQEKETTNSMDMVQVESPLNSSEYFSIKTEDQPLHPEKFSINTSVVPNLDESHIQGSESEDSPVNNASSTSESILSNSEIKSEELDFDSEIPASIAGDIKTDPIYVIRPIIALESDSESDSENNLKDLAELESCAHVNVCNNENICQSDDQSNLINKPTVSVDDERNAGDNSVVSQSMPISESNAILLEDDSQSGSENTLKGPVIQRESGYEPNVSSAQEDCHQSSSRTSACDKPTIPTDDESVSQSILNIKSSTRTISEDTSKNSVTQSQSSPESNIFCEEDRCQPGDLKSACDKSTASVGDEQIEIDNFASQSISTTGSAPFQNKKNCSLDGTLVDSTSQNVPCGTKSTESMDHNSTSPSEKESCDSNKTVCTSTLESNLNVKETPRRTEESLFHSNILTCSNENEESELQPSTNNDSNTIVKNNDGLDRSTHFDANSLISSLPNENETSPSKEKKFVHETMEESSQGTFGNLFTNLSTFTASMTSAHSEIESEPKVLKEMEIDEDKVEIRSLSVVVERLKMTGKKMKFCVCEECGRLFRYKNHLIFHKGTHLKEKPFGCPHCPRRYSGRQALSMHVRRDHDQVIKRIVCDYRDCNFVAFNQPRLDRHKQSVHKIVIENLQLFPCKYCDEKFVYKKTRNIHERVAHTGERPYTCQTCDEKFNDTSVLRRHCMRMHSNKQQHTLKCPFCPKLFFGTCDLGRHIDMHKGVRAFACSLCPKAFIQKPHLTKHMRGIHKTEV